MTIAYRDEAFPDIAPLNSLSNALELRVVGEDMFGEHHDTPVYLVEFADPREFDKVQSYRARYQKTPPGEYAPSTFRPHITKKHVQTPLGVGDTLLASRVFIQEAGEAGISPLYEFQLLYAAIN